MVSMSQQLPVHLGDGLPVRSRRRIVVLDTTVLTTEVIAAAGRPAPSALLQALRSGSVRGFMPHHVWAEVPRVLERRHRDGGRFDLRRAQRLWWTAYVPVIYAVSTDHLPTSEQAALLAARDASDVGSILLFEALAPAALLAEDKDLVASGLACDLWREVRRALGQIETARETRDSARAATNLTVNGGAAAVRQAYRGARAHPLIALSVAALVLVIGAAYERAHPGRLQQVAKQAGLGLLTAIGEAHEQAQAQYRSGQTVWLDAERGRPGTRAVQQVARLLAERGPMTRTEILARLQEIPAGFGNRELMDDLYRMLREFPMFCEVTPGRWQVGRRGVDFGGALAA